MLDEQTSLPANHALHLLSARIAGDKLEMNLAYNAGKRIVPIKNLNIKLKDLLLIKILTRLDELNLELDENAITLVGLEGMYANGQLNSDESASDSFNDSIALIQKQSTGEIVLLRIVTATTEPGKFYTVYPLNVAGAARLPTDVKFTNLWKRGAHKNQVKALIQANEVTVLRDGNKDMLRIGDKPFTGHFGINFHSAKDSAKIGKWSAGCQVVQKQVEFAACISILYASKQKLFSYILLDASKL